MTTLKRLLTCSAFAILILGMHVPGTMAQSHAGHESAKSEAAIEKPDIVMHVTGLACEMCAHSVANTLKKLEAVRDVQVLLEDDQRILLTVDEGAKIDEKTLREAVKAAGFSTRKVVYTGAEKSSS